MARTPDVRVNVDFFDHWKTVELEQKLGYAGVVGLIRLWAWASRFKPTGMINGMPPESVERAVQWRGEPGTLVSALLDLRFLENTTDGLKIHDWEIHNPYAAGAEQRSAKARRAARIRYGLPEAVLGAMPVAVPGASSVHKEGTAPPPPPPPLPLRGQSVEHPPSGGAPKRQVKCACGKPARFWTGSIGQCAECAGV